MASDNAHTEWAACVCISVVAICIAFVVHGCMQNEHQLKLRAPQPTVTITK